MRKRGWKLGVASIGLVVALTGCGGSEPTGVSAQTDPPASENEEEPVDDEQGDESERHDFEMNINAKGSVGTRCEEEPIAQSHDIAVGTQVELYEDSTQLGYGVIDDVKDGANGGCTYKVRFEGDGTSEGVLYTGIPDSSGVEIEWHAKINGENYSLFGIGGGPLCRDAPICNLLLNDPKDEYEHPDI